MKARVLRKIDEHEAILSRLRFDGDGTTFLSDTGEYLNAGGSLIVATHTVAENNFQLTLPVKTGHLYIIKTGNYTGTNLKLNVSGSNCDIVIKNGGHNNYLTFVNALDGQTNARLDPYNAVRLVWDGKNWHVI